MRPSEIPSLSRPAARPLISSLWGRVLDLVFPPRCVACREFGSFLCDGCLGDVARAEPPRCPVCWMIEPQGARCHRCRQCPPAFAGARAAFVYERAAREAVLALKFNGVSAVAPVMAREMARVLLAWDPPVSAVVPVPLGGRRRRLRGYNQSEALAREVARMAGLPVLRGALVRRRATAPQARQPDEESRRRNVEGAFGAGRRAPAGGVLLVDDVMTTGATMDACARALRDGGWGPVYALTFARED